VLAALAAELGCGEARLYPLRRYPRDGGADATDGGGSDAGETNPMPCPNGAVIGYATYAAAAPDGGPSQYGTTGGGNLTTPVVVTSWDQLMAEAGDTTAKVIEVMGTIVAPGLDGGTSGVQVKVGSNKTIVGADGDAAITGGGLFIDTSSNVIVRNLKISGAFHTDAITVQRSTNVWIDHCDLSCDPVDVNGCDGLVDITHASDYVTVSWTYYHDHNASGLVGHSDTNAAEDTGHLTVTYHHDLFTHVFSGPRVRFGSVHVFNVDFEHLGDYAVASTDQANVLVERSVFVDVKTPLITSINGSDQGYLAEGTVDHANSYVAPTSPADNMIGIGATPLQHAPNNYDYAPELDSIGSVQTVVQACAGSGKIPMPLQIPTQ
jgi:pectate lyase